MSEDGLWPYEVKTQAGWTGIAHLVDNERRTTLCGIAYTTSDSRSRRPRVCKRCLAVLRARGRAMMALADKWEAGGDGE